MSGFTGTTTEPELFLVNMVKTNWSNTTGGVIPVVDQGENWQNEDYSNFDYVLIYGFNDSQLPFDLHWASRDRKPLVIIRIATGTSRVRLNQIYGEISRILETRNYFIQPLYNTNVIDAPDMSKDVRLWFEIDMLVELWFVEGVSTS